ncbi:hypothetical protein MASR2M47_04560 [Draconibacterium sp.]|jgi:hypothetical protein
MKLVTVKESQYVNDLVVLKSRLESEGIMCCYKNELTTQVLNYIPSFYVELQVLEKDIPRVREILIETGELPPENSKLVCSKCGSENVKMKVSVIKKIKLFFAVLYALGTNVPMDKLFKKAKYYCKDCGVEVTS